MDRKKLKLRKNKYFLNNIKNNNFSIEKYMNSNYLMENDSQKFFYETSEFLNETTENLNFFEKIFYRPKYPDFEISNSPSEEFVNDSINYQYQSNNQMLMQSNIGELLRTPKEFEKVPINIKSSINSKRKRSLENVDWPLFLGSFAIEIPINSLNFNESNTYYDDIDNKTKPLIKENAYLEMNQKFSSSMNLMKRPEKNNESIEIITKPIDDNVYQTLKKQYKYMLYDMTTTVKLERVEFNLTHSYSEIWNILLNFKIVELKAGKLWNNKLRIDVFLTKQASIKNFDVDAVLALLPSIFDEKAQLYRKQEIIKYCKESLLVLFDMLKIKKIKNSALLLKNKIKLLKERKSINRYNIYPNLVCKLSDTKYYKSSFLIEKQNNVSIIENYKCNLYENNYADGLEENYNFLDKKTKLKNETEVFHFLDSTKFNSYCPPKTMITYLHEYQSQALNWLLYREKFIDENQLYKKINYDIDNSVEENSFQINCLLEEYKLLDGTPLYLNVFTGEVSLEYQLKKFCQGGILADEMGMGKTLMALALIHSNRGKKKENKQNLEGDITKKTKIILLKGESEEISCKTKEDTVNNYQTLIVTPLTILNQWKEEILTHSEVNSLKVGIFYGNTRKKFPLEDYDVILTTYDVLTQDYKTAEKNSSEIFANTWLRVILDEAHCIKNWKSKRAEACSALNATNRWCLTGTPIHNNLDDLYSLLRFLRFEIFGEEYSWFNTYINKAKHHLKILNQIIGPLLLRRTKVSLDRKGNPILSLPGKNIEILRIKMGVDQRKIYDDLYSKSRDRFQLFLKHGVALQNYTGIFAMLIKLRQCCDHPSLVIKKIDNDGIEEGVRDFLMKGKEKEMAAARKRNELLEINIDKLDPFKGKEFYEETIKKIKSEEFSDCSVCLSDMTQAALSKCCHILCFSCFQQSIEYNGQCPICRTSLTINDICEIYNKYIIFI